NNLLLIGKGLAGTKTDAGAAKRVFLVDTGNSGFTVDSAEDLRIGVGGGNFSAFHRPINLEVGGSVNNHLTTINDAEVKKFFDTNNVVVNAEAGGNPTGLIRFKNIADHLDDTAITANDLTKPDDGLNTGSIKLTIGKGASAYSNTVTLFDVDDDMSTDTTDDDELPDPKPFSATNKNAITYVDSNNDTLLEAIADALISAFPPFFDSNGVIDQVGTADGERPDVAAHVPYGVSDRHNAGGDNGSHTAIVGVLDAQRIAANIDVKIDNKIKGGNAATILKVAGGDNAKIRQVNIKNDPNTIQITLTSKVAGKDESTIGVPIVDETATDFVLPNSNIATTPGAYVYAGTSPGDISKELPIAKTNPRKSSLPKAGSDDSTSEGGPKDLDRLGWL
ncbi:MAG: hypothetical protein OXC61_01820, partial [Flavobacteriaceae bacterium]|nr:hypothetical protein [Flavobacteriaceae bacterium]